MFRLGNPWGAFLVSLSALGALFANPAQVRADPYFLSSRPAFNAAAPGLFLEDFEKGQVAPGAIVAVPSPLSSTTNHPVFQPGTILAGLTFQDDPLGPSPTDLALAGVGFSGVPSKTLFSATGSDSLDILINPGAHALGLDVFSEFGDSTILVSVFGAGGLMDTTLVNALSSGVPTFIGIVDPTELMTRINLRSLTGQFEGIDNVATRAVPEPASLALLVLGVVGVFGYRWRRRLA